MARASFHPGISISHIPPPLLTVVLIPRFQFFLLLLHLSSSDCFWILLSTNMADQQAQHSRAASGPAAPVNLHDLAPLPEDGGDLEAVSS